MKTVGLAALLLSGAIASLPGAPQAVASPESDYCRAMASAGVPGECATLTSLAKDVCAQYDRGLDLAAVVETLDAATKDQQLSNFIIAGAPMYFCPEHDDKT